MQNSSILSPLPQVPTDVLASSGSRLEDKIRVAQSSAGEKRNQEIKKVSQEFEAIFLAQLLKVMRDTIEESGLLGGGFGKSIYAELFDQEVSLSIARQGALGISDLLYRNLSEKISGSGDPTGMDPVPEKPGMATPVKTEPAAQEQEISDLQLPVQAPVSSAFGMRRDPFSHRLRFHKGLDLAAPEGMRVVSALPGTVVSAGYEKGYGNTVVVRHGDGVQTRYGHLGSIKVRAGDYVDSEAELGTVGSTGRSTGPHLHFEVIRMGTPVDPLARVDSHPASSGQGLGHSKTGG